MPRGIPPLFRDYTFQRFVEGPGNAQAAAIARTVAERHGKLETAIIPNGLFLHGRPGLGKTHLMIAIAQAVQQRHPHSWIAYRSAHSFREELTAALRARRLDFMRKRYLWLDMLLVDNLELLESMSRTRGEICAFLDSFLRCGKTVVLAGASPLEERGGLRDGLTSECFLGLVSEVNPLDKGGRAAILRSLLKEWQEPQGRLLPTITEEGVEFLAGLELPDVRELSGLLNWMIFNLAETTGVWTAERLHGLMAESVASGQTLPGFRPGTN
jgi:chromosomal replication initiator protein